MKSFARSLAGIALVGALGIARSARAEDVTFTGVPISVRLEPGRLAELVFPREVLDVISGDEVLVATKPGDAVVYIRPARPAFETSLFVRVAGGYSIPVEVREATDGHPTIALRISFDKHLRALEGLARGEPESIKRPTEPATFSPIALLRAMYLDQPLAGYSIVDGGAVNDGATIDLARPDLVIRRVKTWVSPSWDGLVLEVENQTDQPLHLDPMSFQGQGSLAPRYVYVATETLAPRPTVASAAVVGGHRTRVLLVRPAAKPSGSGLVPRSPRVVPPGGGPSRPSDAPSRRDTTNIGPTAAGPSGFDRGAGLGLSSRPTSLGARADTRNPTTAMPGGEERP